MDVVCICYDCFSNLVSIFACMFVLIGSRNLQIDYQNWTCVDLEQAVTTTAKDQTLMEVLLYNWPMSKFNESIACITEKD